MDDLLREIASNLPLLALVAIVAVAVYVLSKGADILVTQAVALSRRFNVSPVIIGATIVSLGTTTPETAVSVMSAIGGDSGLALGNAVGSVICNAALIIGVASLIRPIPADRQMVWRQGSVQFAAMILLIIGSLPFVTGTSGSIFVDGGRFPQWAGVIFVVMLLGYLAVSVHWSRTHVGPADLVGEEIDEAPVPHSPRETLFTVIKLLVGLALVIIASQVLIPAVEATALRIGVPRAVVAASLVALGTSLPELVTAITASRKGHGELALGNVVGANVLNVLFVAGLSATVTRGGLAVGPEFFRLFFPAMLISGILLYGVVLLGRGRIGRPVGVTLIVLYAGLVALGYTI